MFSHWRARLFVLYFVGSVLFVLSFWLFGAGFSAGLGLDLLLIVEVLAYAINHTLFFYSLSFYFFRGWLAGGV